MNTRRCQAVLLALGAVVAGMIGARGAQAQGVSPEALTNFQWFSGLGFPDVKGCPLVRVADGGYSDNGDGAPKPDYLAAFLLATNGDSFKVLTLDLGEETFTKKPPRILDIGRVGFEVLNLREEATARRDALLALRGFSPWLSRRGEFFLLAWACWRQGLNDLAQDIYTESLKVPRRGNPTGASSTFLEDMEKDIGKAVFCRAILACGDVGITRPEMLQHFEKVVNEYPRSEYFERARQTADVLRQMIAEDDAHGKTEPKDLNQLPPEERVRELIYRLRDQRMRDIDHGMFAINISSEGTNKSTAHELVDMGYTAVPQLIKAIGSPNLTRSVVDLSPRRHATGYFTYDVASVGSFAVVILEQITGKSWNLGSTNAQAAFQAWWDEFQRKGEKQMLVEAVASGGWDAAAQADLLCQQYPDAATAALIQGIKVADWPRSPVWTRASLVEHLGKLPATPATTDFLLDEMLHDPQLQARVAAARVLRQWGKPEAVPAMIAEYEKSTFQGPEEGGVLYQLHDFLAGCDSAQAIEALGRDLRQRTAETKSHVVASVGSTNRPGSLTRAPATMEAIERFLVAELEDSGEYQGYDQWEYGMEVSDPRICDMAALFMAKRWPNRYPMSLPGNIKTRERRRIEFLNTWRTAHQLPILPLPQTGQAAIAAAEAAKVTVVEWSRDSAKPTQSFAARIGGFKDKLLRAEDMVAVMTDFTLHHEPDASRLIIKAEKNEYLSGVVLTVTLLPSQQTKKEWQWDDFVLVGTQTNDIHGIGRGWFSAVPPLDPGKGFIGVLQKAIDSPAETPFEINVEVKGLQ